MQVQPYLSFEGRCDEAIDFYQKAVGAKVDMLMRFKESPDQSMVTPQSKDKVMHAAVHIGDTQILMSDGRCQGSPNFNGIALALSAPSDADAERMFNALAEGGKVNMPLTKTFFSSRFGMVADKFGVGWMVLVDHSVKHDAGVEEHDMTVETKTADFVISRVFDAPRDLVWQCFTDPERMKEWWGPKGCTIVASNMDFRVGGTYLGAMRDPGGNVMWGKFVYREITPPHAWSGLIRFRLRPAAPPGIRSVRPGRSAAHDRHLRGAAGRQDQSHACLVAAQCDG